MEPADFDDGLDRRQEGVSQDDSRVRLSLGVSDAAFVEMAMLVSVTPFSKHLHGSLSPILFVSAPMLFLHLDPPWHAY